MYQVIIVFHVLFGLGIIGLVLMQQGKGADAGAAFGAGASGSVFGAQGAASFLSRTTAILATLFFVTSLSLAVFNSQKGIAYDFMSEPEADKETSTLPIVDGAQKSAVTPDAPVIQSEETPAVAPQPSVIEKPAVAEKPAASETEVKDAAPKAEETKAVPVESNKTENPAAAAPEAKKEAAKK